MPRLTDRQIKRIFADRSEGMSIRQLAAKYGVSGTTIHNTLKRHPELERMVTQKKEENTLEMFAYMDSRKEQAQDVIDKYLKALADPEKLESASLSQIATALGIIVDKFTKNTASGNDSLNKLDGLLKEFKDAVKPEAN